MGSIINPNMRKVKYLFTDPSHNKITMMIALTNASLKL